MKLTPALMDVSRRNATAQHQTRVRRECERNQVSQQQSHSL